VISRSLSNLAARLPNYAMQRSLEGTSGLQRSYWGRHVSNKRITVGGKKLKKGKHLTRASRWELVAVTGRKRTFDATLVKTINFKNLRLAIFRVPKFK
jgi:hypothetical protein